MPTLLKKITLMTALILATITTAKASDTFSHTVLLLPDDPRIETQWSRTIGSQEEWESFFNQSLTYMTFLVGQSPIAPALDFEQHQIVTGGMGVQNTGGYLLSVNQVSELENEIIIHTLMIRPSANCLVPLAISYPSTTILIEKTNKPIRFSLSQLVDECL